MMFTVCFVLGLVLGAGGSPSPQTVVKVPPRIAAKTCPPPVYPAWSRQHGEEGTVTLLVKVDEKGKVLEVLVAEPCRHLALNRAARDAVSRWRMLPATNNGIPVADTVRIPVMFQLRPRASSAKT